MQMASVEIHLNQHFHYDENDFQHWSKLPHSKVREILHFASSSTSYTAKSLKNILLVLFYTLSQIHAHTHSKPMFGYPLKREEFQKTIALNCTKVL